MNNMITALNQIAKWMVVLAVCIGVCKGLAQYVKKRWMWKNADLSVGSNPQGIVFGRTKAGQTVWSSAESEGHCAVFGGSGSGKTSAVLIPSLRAWTNAGCTCYVIDISGDINKNVDCSNKIVYEPGAQNSAPYDVFALIDGLDDEDDQNEALAQLAYLLMPTVKNANSTSAYFQDGGRTILTAALISDYHQGYDFCDICRRILSSGYNALFDDIDETGNATAVMYINQFLKGNSETIAGCKEACDAAIKLFAINWKVRESIRRPRPGEMALTPASIETQNVFVVIPDTKLKLFAPLLNIITAQALSYFADRPMLSQHNILFALDEFASLCLDISDALRKLRKRNVRIMVLTQSIADIDDVLGSDAHKALLANFKYKILLDIAEADTQLYFARLIGKTAKSKKSTTSKNGQTVSETWSEEWCYAVEPADLARTGNTLILLHPRGWCKLRKAYFFKR